MVLEAYYGLLHETHDALLQRCQAPSKRPTLSTTPSWFQTWSRAHPYEAPPSPVHGSGDLSSSAPAVGSIVSAKMRRRRARYRPIFPTQALRPFTAPGPPSRRDRQTRRPIPTEPQGAAAVRPIPAAAAGGSGFSYLMKFFLSFFLRGVAACLVDMENWC